MKKFGFWEAFALAGALMPRIAAAASDGKVTRREVTEIIHAVLDELDLEVEIELPDRGNRTP